MVDTVIFDMDGTLVDSKKLAVRAWVAASRAMDLDLSAEEVKLTILGRTKSDIIDSPSNHFGSRRTAPELISYQNFVNEQHVPSY